MSIYLIGTDVFWIELILIARTSVFLSSNKKTCIYLAPYNTRARKLSFQKFQC